MKALTNLEKDTVRRLNATRRDAWLTACDETQGPAQVREFFADIARKCAGRVREIAGNERRKK